MHGFFDTARAVRDLIAQARRGVGAVIAAVAMLLASIAGAVGAVGDAVDAIARQVAGSDTTTSARPTTMRDAVTDMASASATAAVPIAPVAGAADAAGELVLHGTARQGGLLLGRAPAGTVRLALDGAPVRLGPERRFVIAFDRDAGPVARLDAVLADGSRAARAIDVVPGAWRIERVNAAMRGGAGSDAEYAARRAGELARINAARKVDVDSDGWRQSFIWPATGRVSGLFGAQRVYRGVPGSYHSGVDVAAGAGTSFHAPADGVVTLAAATPFTLEGHLVILDHGMGLSSAFLHAASLAVREGQVVRQGDRLGTVGATGRASGPHLHWGMKWNAARIDPLRLVGPMIVSAPAR